MSSFQVQWQASRGRHQKHSSIVGCVVHGHQVAAVIAVLKEARKLQLLTQLEVAEVGQRSLRIPAPLLLRASVHASDALRIDALQLACVNPKSTMLPGEHGPGLAEPEQRKLSGGRTPNHKLAACPLQNV